MELTLQGKHRPLTSCLLGLYSCRWRRRHGSPARPGDCCCGKVSGPPPCLQTLISPSVNVNFLLPARAVGRRQLRSAGGGLLPHAAFPLLLDASQERLQWLWLVGRRRMTPALSTTNYEGVCACLGSTMASWASGGRGRWCCWSSPPCSSPTWPGSWWEMLTRCIVLGGPDRDGLFEGDADSVWETLTQV